MNTIQTLMDLTAVRTRREYLIEQATRDMLWENTIDPLYDVRAIVADNEETDIDIRRHFLGVSPEVTELHLKRCEESGVPQCTCLVKPCVKMDLEAF